MQTKFFICLTLFASAAFTNAQEDAPAEEGGGGGSHGGFKCESDVASEAAKATSFSQPQSRPFVTCGSVPRDICITVDEAGQQCGCTCKDRVEGNSEPPQQANNNNNPPDNSGGKKGKGKKGGKCFHGDANVHTEQYGTITMRQLAEEHRDARVLSRNDDGQLEYSPINFWLHAKKVDADFVRLTTASGKALALSDEHLIYETDCRGGAGVATFAKKVTVGKCLYVNGENGLEETRVVRKEKTRLNGIYAPITTTGSIIVDDVLASCYTVYENESVQKIVYKYMPTIQNLMSNFLPASFYDAAFNQQNDATVGIPRIIFNVLNLSKYFVY